MIPFLILFIRIVAQVIFLLIIADVITSYFLSPYHPVKATLSRILDPLLTPIRKIVKPVGTLDFSPLILIILIQVIEVLLVSLISGFG